MESHTLLGAEGFKNIVQGAQMLVLSRKTDEKIVFHIDGYDTPIELTVVRIDRNKVRLGIEAEPGITILRSELTEPRASKAS